MYLFEVVIAPGYDPDSLLSAETLRETQAQIMTLDEARAVGFSGLQPDPKGRELRFIAVARRDAQWIHRQLEAHGAVTSYRVHEID